MLMIHSSCAKKTKKVIKNINYRHIEAFNNWLYRLNYNIEAQLNHLDLRKCNLKNIFLG